MKLAEMLATMIGYVLIVVAQEMGVIEITPAQAEAEVAELRRMVREAMAAGNYAAIGLPAEVAAIEITD
jgi:hypothetical protein